MSGIPLTEKARDISPSRLHGKAAALFQAERCVANETAFPHAKNTSEPGSGTTYTKITYDRHRLRVLQCPVN